MKTKQFRYTIISALIFCACVLLNAQTYNLNQSDDKRLSVATKTEDQALLAEIAQNDPASFVRRVAVGKIIDDQLLEKIAQNDMDEKVRETARAKLAQISAESAAWKARQDVFEAASKQIILFPPLVKFISIENDSILNPDQFHGQNIQTSLNNKIVELLSNKGFEVLKPDSYSSNPNYEILTSNISRLFYSQLNDSMELSLSDFGAQYSNANILAVELKVKIGDIGSWDPLSGMITLGNSYSVVQAELLTPQNAQKLWKNRSLFREIPNIEKSSIDEAIEQLFTNLTFGKETGNEKDTN